MRSPIFKFRGESSSSYISGFGMLGLLICFAFALTLQGKVLGIVVCVAIVGLIIFLISRIIKTVEFFDSNITVKYFLNRQIEIPYSKISQVYYNKEGFLPEHVYVIKFLKREKITKATFHCSENDFIRVTKILNEKGVKQSRNSLTINTKK